MCLERNLIRDAPSSLANQIPVASGVCSSRERRRAIDLVELCRPSEYTFFELKVNATYPLHAAMELLGYGACYVAARRNILSLQYNTNEKPLLEATIVHLRVLAPLHYYRVGQPNCPSLIWLQDAINAGLQCVEEFVESLQMDFRFDAFPIDFVLKSDPAVSRDCLGRRVPAYPPAPQ